MDDSGGLYGGRKNKRRFLRCPCSNGASTRAWWYAAGFSTRTMRWPAPRWRSILRTKAAKVSPLNTGQTWVTKRPVLRLTAPKQPTDLHVGACGTTGSRCSGAIHMRQPDPCCGKWHSSRLHRSMSPRLASGRSFSCHRHCLRVGRRHLRARRAQPKAHLPEHPLALPDAQRDLIAVPQMLGQHGTIPPIRPQAELRGRPAQVHFDARPALRIQRTRLPRTRGIAQAGGAGGIKSSNSG